MRLGAVKRGGGARRALKHCQVVKRVTASRPRRLDRLGNIVVGTHMQDAVQKLGILALVGAAAFGLAACSPPPVHHLSVDDLLEDRVMLDGILLKCDQDFGKARNDADCENARIAVERLAAQQEPAEEAKRRDEFERTREKLRLAEEKQRDQAAKPKLDGYSLPMVPVDPPPSAASTDDQKPTVMGQTKP
jgi:hypothetical protein